MGGPFLITGGGTGGHVFPMQAIAEQLFEQGVAPDDVRFVGSRRGLEAKILAGSPTKLTLLPGRGIRRSMRPRDAGANLGAVVGLVLGVLEALAMVGRWRPRAVVSVGGYASFAVSLAAIIWRRPLVLVELDAQPGAAQRWLTRFATKRCRAFPSSERNTVQSGAPIRASIVAVDRSADGRARARAAMEPAIQPGRMVVVVMTGSLGSTKVNKTVSELAGLWKNRSDRTIVHVTGRRDFAWVTGARPTTTDLDYRIIEFAEMDRLWAVCDVAVCRSGAITMAELAALAIPSILIPLPGAPGDHQTRNAEELARVGGARMIEDNILSARLLGETLDEVMEPTTLGSMSSTTATFGRHDAAKVIAAVVLEVGRR